MKIEYRPSEVKSYTTVEDFRVTCMDSNIAMWARGESVRFLGYNGATAQWDEYGFSRDKLTIGLLQKFMDAYNNRGKS